MAGMACISGRQEHEKGSFPILFRMNAANARAHVVLKSGGYSSDKTNG
jgi:hypothetical protein